VVEGFFQRLAGIVSDMLKTIFGFFDNEAGNTDGDDYVVTGFDHLSLLS
jgi:hypothetical protein